MQDDMAKLVGEREALPLRVRLHRIVGLQHLWELVRNGQRGHRRLGKVREQSTEAVEVDRDIRAGLQLVVAR